MSTSSTSPSPIRRVSIRTPRDAASAASDWPSPVVSLPSDSRTIRFCASSGKSAAGEAQGGADVGRRRDRGRGEPVDLGQLGRQPLDERALAERDDPRDVAVGSFLRASRAGTRARPRGRRCRPNRRGRRRRPSPADRPAGRAGSPPGRTPAPRAAASGRPGPTRRRPEPNAPARREWSPMVSTQRRDQQEQRERRVERRRPSGGPVRDVPREPRAEAALQPDQRVAVVDGPLDAQHEEDEQDDRDPQLVAGRGPGRCRSAGPPVPGAADEAGATPSASMVAAEPGAIVDSSTSKRATAKRTGAYGSIGGADGAGEPGRRRAAPDWRRRRPSAGAGGARARRRRRRRRRRHVRRDDVDPRQVRRPRT